MGKICIQIVVRKYRHGEGGCRKSKKKNANICYGESLAQNTVGPLIVYVRQKLHAKKVRFLLHIYFGLW